MGYDSKLIFVDKSKLFFDKDGFTFAEKIAEIDLCKMGDGPFRELIKNAKYTDCYYYADDGNTAIKEDRYDERLKEVGLEELKEVLIDDGYRRIAPALALINSFIENKKKWRNIKILHFGH